MVVQVAFDRISSAVLTDGSAVGGFSAVCLPPKAVLQLCWAAVGGMGYAPRQREPGRGCRSPIIIAGSKIGISTDGEVLGVSPGNLFGSGGGAGGDDRASAYQLGEGCCPFDSACSAERSSDDMVKTLNPQPGDKFGFGSYRVANSDVREA